MRMVVLLVIAVLMPLRGEYSRDRQERGTCVLARNGSSGCCSHHGGVCGCKQHSTVCCDGSYSASCDC